MCIKTSWNYFKHHVLSKNADRIFEVIDLIKHMLNVLNEF